MLNYFFPPHKVFINAKYFAALMRTQFPVNSKLCASIFSFLELEQQKRHQFSFLKGQKKGQGGG